MLAGVEMPAVWAPDVITRDDRELVRRRLAVAEDGAAVQTRIRWLLKRHGVEEAPAEPRTNAYCQWLKEGLKGVLPARASAALASLLRQMEWLWSEVERGAPSIAQRWVGDDRAGRTPRK